MTSDSRSAASRRLYGTFAATSLLALALLALGLWPRAPRPLSHAATPFETDQPPSAARP
jgi:hypothetical protein